MFWYCVWRCREVKDERVLVQPEQKTKKVEKQPLSKSLKALLKNRMIIICVVMVFFGAIAAIARMSLLSYYLIYVAGAYNYIAPTFTIISMMQIVGNLLLPAATRKFGKIRWFVMTMGMNALSMIFLFLAPAGNVPILLICSAVYGITNSATSISYSMLCDSIEYGDYMFGVRDDALAFSFQSFGVKVAQAVTGSIGVLALAAVGYVANAQQTPQALTGINVIVNLAPAILTLLSLSLMIFYKLDEKAMEKIRVTLEARRAGNMLPDDPMNK
jgi:GPH family glycoside/pentoside/hexuronide:cation symporter/probable glucitol transport protein GutA